MTTTLAPNLADIRLALPPTLEWRGGEWDWFTELSFGDQQFCRRHMVSGGMSPDHLATILDTDVDDACRQWLELVRLASVTGSASSDRSSDPNRRNIDADGWRLLMDLVGPIEVAERLGVKIATVHMWRHRRLMPEPLQTISGVPLWRWDTIETWARSTDRL